MNVRMRTTLEGRALTPAERTADKVSLVMILVLILGGVVYFVTATVARQYALNHCEGVPPHGWVRNHEVTSRPVCREGEWTVTIARENIDPHVYGWNCYFDSPSGCGSAGFIEHKPFCFTDERDGYTMCPDGRVYHVDSNGGELDPVIRAPIDTDKTPTLN